MKQKKSIVLGLVLGVFWLQSASLAESHYRYIQNPKTDIYFGHISYLDVSSQGEMPFILREGKTAPETAVLNFPLAPGDTIVTPEGSRCEIQFDTGTILRLDSKTEVTLETILAPSLLSSFNLTNMVLKNGQVYIMYKQYGASEILQLIVPYASAKLKHNTRMMMRNNGNGTTDIQVWGGQASVLFGENESTLKYALLKKSMSMTVSAFHTAKAADYTNGAEFYLWNQNINQNYDQLHTGLTAIPKPVQRLSPAVYDFAQKFSNRYGEWVWNDIYGYVWRPFTNDYYPTGTWQPYYYGQWREINSNLFWVPQESWGWVPYHLGNWIWNKRLGWVWIPGSAFAPAWVDWRFYFGRFSWRPLNLIETYFIGPYWLCFYCNMPDYAYMEKQLAQKLPPDIDSFDGGDNWDIVSPETSVQGESGDKKILNKNQLKQTKTESIKVSKDIRIVLSRLAEAIRDGNEEVLASINEMPGTVVVHAQDLNHPQVYTLTESFGTLDKEIQAELRVHNRQKDSMGAAASVFQMNEIISTVDKSRISNESANRIAVSSEKRQVVPPVRQPDNRIEFYGRTDVPGSYLLAKPSTRSSQSRDGVKSDNRFRDWNPDLRVAANLGVRIEYSSKDNTISCPDLGISNGNRSSSLSSYVRSANSYRASSSSTGGSSGAVSTSSSTTSRSSSNTSASSRTSSSSSSGRTGSGSTTRTIKK